MKEYTCVPVLNVYMLKWVLDTIVESVSSKISIEIGFIFGTSMIQVIKEKIYLIRCFEFAALKLIDS